MPEVQLEPKAVRLQSRKEDNSSEHKQRKHT